MLAGRPSSMIANESPRSSLDECLRWPRYCDALGAYEAKFVEVKEPAGADPHRRRDEASAHNGREALAPRRRARACGPSGSSFASGGRPVETYRRLTLDQALELLGPAPQTAGVVAPPA